MCVHVCVCGYVFECVMCLCVCMCLRACVREFVSVCTHKLVCVCVCII